MDHVWEIVNEISLHLKNISFINEVLKNIPDETQPIFLLGTFLSIITFISLLILPKIFSILSSTISKGGSSAVSFQSAVNSEFSELFDALSTWETKISSLPSTDAIWEIGVSKRAITVAEEANVRTIFLLENVPTTTGGSDDGCLFSPEHIYAVLVKAMIQPDYEGATVHPKRPSIAVVLPSRVCSDDTVEKVNALTQEKLGIRVQTVESMGDELDKLKAQRKQNMFKEEKEKAKAAAASATKKPVEMAQQPNRACFKCKKEIPGKASQCSACKAIIYCSVECAKKDWSEHKQLCPKFKQHMQHVDQWNLHDFPFTFYNSKKILCSYNQVNTLVERGLHNVGIFKRLCACYQNVPFGQLWHEAMVSVKASNGTKKDIFDILGLDDRMFPLSKSPKEGVDPLAISSWKELYEAMGWEFDNVAAMVLHVPMTVYHLINTYHLKKASPLKENERRKITIHMVGVETEADYLPLFEILLAFYKSTDLCIHFIGPAISPSIPPQDRAMGIKSESNDSTLFMTIQTSMYSPSHADGTVFKLPDDMPEEVKSSRNFGEGKPDLIILQNPNLLAYGEWVPTLQHLYQSGAPVLFTDGMEQIVESVDANLPAIQAKLSLKAQVNPFRQPVYQFNPEVNLPCWANGFVFGMGKI